MAAQALLRLLPLKRADLRQPPAMPLQPRKLRRHISANQIERQLSRDNPGANAHDIAVVIFHRLVRRKNLVTSRRADSGKLVGCYANAGPAAAYQNCPYL